MKVTINVISRRSFQIIEISVNSPVDLDGLMSCRPNVLLAKCLSVKGPVGQTSVDLVSVDEMSVGQTSGHRF